VTISQQRDFEIGQQLHFAHIASIVLARAATGQVYFRKVAKNFGQSFLSAREDGRWPVSCFLSGRKSG
jgi:hypothetical protein